MDTLGNIFLASAISRVNYYKQLADKTFAQLEEKDFYYSPNEASNSLAVIIQHMSGNMLSRWTNFLTQDGEKPWRNRDTEFSANNYNRRALIEFWEKGWDCFLGALKQLNENDLLKTIYIRNEPLIVIDAINRQLAHYPHHVGQIIYIGKLIRNEQWQSLSIEKGQSVAFNNMMTQKHVQ
jgi:hypothetical protein